MTESRIRTRVVGWMLVTLLVTGLAGCRKTSYPTVHHFETHNEAGMIEVAESESARIVDIATLLKGHFLLLEHVFDLRKSYSEISEINEHAAVLRMPMKPNLDRFMRYAVQYNEMTDGAFDVSMGSLRTMWGFDNGEVPDEVTMEIAQASISTLGMDQLTVANGLVFFKNSLIKIDPAGMLDGYLVDLTILKLRDNLHRDLVIRVGNSSRALGIDSRGDYWTHPVYDPVQTNRVFATVKLKDRMGASSSYRNADWIQASNQRIYHILDPKTGLSPTGVLSATVVGPTANKSDALATALIVAGPEKARQFLREFKRCEAMLVLEETPPRVWMSEGFADYVEFVPGHGMEIDTFSAAADFSDLGSTTNAPPTVIEVPGTPAPPSPTPIPGQ